jgi:hypothetical protein
MQDRQGSSEDEPGPFVPADARTASHGAAPAAAPDPAERAAFGNLVRAWCFGPGAFVVHWLILVRQGGPSGGIDPVGCVLLLSLVVSVVQFLLFFAYASAVRRIGASTWAIAVFWCSYAAGLIVRGNAAAVMLSCGLLASHAWLLIAVFRQRDPFLLPLHRIRYLLLVGVFVVPLLFYQASIARPGDPYGEWTLDRMFGDCAAGRQAYERGDDAEAVRLWERWAWHPEFGSEKDLDHARERLRAKRERDRK